MLPFLVNFVKEAIAAPNKDPARKVEQHLEAEKKDWSGFEKNLKSGKFRQAIQDSGRADEQLKRYVESMGALIQSRRVVAKVLSKTEPGKTYSVKKLKNGRLGCTCRDWQYKHSILGTDCKHVREHLSAGLPKAASATSHLSTGLFRGIGVGRSNRGMWKNWEKGKEIEGVRRQQNAGHRDEVQRGETP